MSNLVLGIVLMLFGFVLYFYTTDLLYSGKQSFLIFSEMANDPNLSHETKESAKILAKDSKPIHTAYFVVRTVGILLACISGYILGPYIFSLF